MYSFVQIKREIKTNTEIGSILIYPIHDNSVYDNGPDTSGVSVDRSNGNAGDKNPILHP